MERKGGVVVTMLIGSVLSGRFTLLCLSQALSVARSQAVGAARGSSVVTAVANGVFLCRSDAQIYSG